MKFKWLIIYALMLLSAYSCVGQQIKHPVKTTTVPTSYCLADSLKQAISKLRYRADAVITFQHYYDNGTAESATIFWQVSGRTFGRSFQDCKPSKTLETRLPPDTLFSFYRQQRIADLPEMPRPANSSSHGMIYLIGVYTPGKTCFYKIRDNQRHAIIFPDPNQTLPGEAPAVAKEDPRSTWLDLFEEVIK
ncbi:hypothetical protein EJV47_07605 [Hymenobacter gummosus]|uniref:Lipoprotein n=1 Tax=Hymenobacter gummosus TaxID=1776032 RepID=A0A431U5P1_9BACT|nr:hypothetical protein [Hymenobacter gummosus]RTQ51654.1 hypothetical protein EJV47_07605 [Hymenobacter gummosus]